LNHNWRILTWTSSGCQNFSFPLLRRRHRVHTIAAIRPAFTAASGNHVVSLLLRRRHPAPPPPPPAPRQGPSRCLHCRRRRAQELRRPPGRHRLEPRHPPGRHRRRVHLQEFGKPPLSLFLTPSVKFILLCLDVCLDDYA
jgi:hypothetical protein